MPTDLWLFLSVICHKSEADLQTITFEDATRYEKRFFEIVGDLFGTLNAGGMEGIKNKVESIHKGLPEGSTERMKDPIRLTKPLPPHFKKE